jgi:biopolymer transport protein ExbD
MGMNIGSGSGSDEPEVMIDMNTTPLIDVMLVLLVMLIITIPIQLHSVEMNLPVGTPPVNSVKPDKVQIDIDEKSVVYWQGLPVTGAKLEANMSAAGKLSEQPEVHIRPDKNARYEVFADVLASSKRKGLTKMAVIGSEQFIK